ncbi:MAG: acetate kinase [Fulvimarina sp.]|nr:acetate kinase [Fulvimarina sp.]
METPGPACILTINGGSSSIKFALFDVSNPPRRLLRGSIDRIGQPDAALRVEATATSPAISESVDAADYGAAIDTLIATVATDEAARSVVAIGHRVVHGGPRYAAPQRLTKEVIGDLRILSAFDPEHLPQEIRLIEAFAEHFPGIPQIACFDTAFHHDMPAVAQLLPIPRRYQAQGLRRYGFHGLSYAYLIEELGRIAGREAANGRVILAHLGSGASLAAVRGGKSIDTSMGLTPAAGIPMSTRSGDLDPGLMGHLARTERMTPAAFTKMVNFESGLLGISETSADMHELVDREAHDPRDAEAVALFCYEAKKCIGAYAAALGGMDTLVFSGGIGENAPTIRARICEGLGFLGIAIDPERNEQGAALISPDSGAVAVRVIATDEESMIAKSVQTVIYSGSR